VRKTRRTEITVETDEIVVISGTRRAVQAWCPECDEAVRMITPDEAAALASASSRTIYQAVEDGRLHNIETTDGVLLVCLKSLSRSFGADNHFQWRRLANSSDRGGEDQ